MNEEIVIEANNVYKDFILPHERVGTIKGIFTSMFQQATSKKETQHALKNISFSVKKGEFFGIVGRNGSGKSTMLKILAGIYPPTKGNVKTKGKLVPFIELGVGFNPELSGRDNVYLNGAILGFNNKQIDDMYNSIVEFAELERFMDQKLKNYSSGMQVRLAFSMAVRSEADILLIDEVLAVGDSDFQRKCFDYFRNLKKNKKTVVFVTHDMDAVREYCDRAILIENNEIINEGPASSIASLYTRMFIKTSRESENLVGKNRWGDGRIIFTKVALSSKKLTDASDLEISVAIQARRATENVNVGFLIKNSASLQILGTNTTVKKIMLEDLKKGQKLEIKWTVPNIFSDGVYYVDPAIVHNKVEVADWWEEAATFRVLNDEKVPYPINPDIKTKVMHSIHD